MLDLSQQMEVSYKVNKLIRKMNTEFGLSLKLPHITYKLTNTIDAGETLGSSLINFNKGLRDIDTGVIEHEVAHLVNFAINREDSSHHSATWENIMTAMKTSTARPEVKEKIEADAKAKATPKAKAKPAKAKEPKVTVIKTVKSGTKIELAVKTYKSVMEKNAATTRQEMITALVEAFELEGEKARVKAAGFYQNAKKAVEAEA